MKFDGKEKLSDWYDGVWDWKFENGIVYAKLNENENWQRVEFKNKSTISKIQDLFGRFVRYFSDKK